MSADTETKEQPNFEQSGALARETNSLNGVTLKYSLPIDARLPETPWRLYVFKGMDTRHVYPLKNKTAFLLGRDRLVVDIPADHTSVSKQHAVIQFRLVKGIGDDGRKTLQTKPFIIDLNSANGTKVNGMIIPASRYYELRPKDTINIGHSTRDYVLLDERE